jgi:ABC-2 type transport system ATP-binding protein
MLHLDHLRKAFGSTVAVDDLSLTIPRGRVFGLLGPNGAGKTTTISMAVGLLRPDSGVVDLDGRGSPMDPEVRRGIGVAPQTIALYDDLSAAENLVFFARLYGLASACVRRRAGELLDLVGLADRARDRVKAFSGGMKRRLNLAAALLHDPPLVLLDEPTAGVDPQSRNAILDIVRSLRDQGRTVVYTTHYMEEAQRLCDQVAIIDRGRLLALDTVEGLIRTHGGSSLLTVHRAAGEERLRTSDPVADLAVRLREPDVLNVRIDRPDLEAVFLALTGRSLRD